MARMWMDPRSGRELLVYSRKEIQTQVKMKMLTELGIDLHDVDCTCCGLRLTDLSKIKVSGRGAIGPECSKPGHVMPCRHKIGVPVQRS